MLELKCLLMRGGCKGKVYGMGKHRKRLKKGLLHLIPVCVKLKGN